MKPLTTSTASGMTGVAESVDLVSDSEDAKDGSVSPSLLFVSESRESLVDVSPDGNGADLSEEEACALQMHLWNLLAKRTALYTMGESSSLPELTAKRLFESVCFTLDIDLSDADPVEVRRILKTDIFEEFDRGLRKIEKKLEHGKELWQTVCLSTPLLESVALKDTLESLKTFSSLYDYRYFAQEIPCDIDYQLCHAVPELLQGVNFVNEYLRRILIENEFLRHFDVRLCTTLLTHIDQNYRELIINLYEPVAINALGLTLIKGDVRSLSVSAADRAAIAHVQATHSEQAMADLLKSAADSLCDRFSIGNLDSRAYHEKLALSLRPRIATLCARGSLDGLFLSL